MTQITLHVNGRDRMVDLGDPDTPLLYVLRDDLALHGPKFGCGHGQCGACAVIVDGQSVRSCTAKAASVKGRITTLEGLGSPEQPSKVQAAFIAEAAAQCGYCTNGMIVAATALLEFLLGPGRLAGEYVHAAGQYVREVMTRDVHTVTEATPLEEIISLMERNHIKRVPVVRGQKVVGIVTRQNLLRALADVAVAGRSAAPADDVAVAGRSAAPADDETIRERLVNDVRQQPWAPLIFDPVVSNGNVKLVGTVFDDRQREAIRIVAENVPGVKSIEDELVWIEPTSGMVIQPAAA